MSRSLPRPILVVVLLASLCAVGCKSYVHVPREAATHVLSAGDQVRVRTMDGRLLQFEVQSVDSASVTAPNERLALTDIVQIERKQVRLINSGDWGLGLLTAGLLLLLLATATIF